MKRMILALAAVAALTIGPGLASTVQAGHPHHHHHHHHGGGFGYSAGYGGYGGYPYYQRPYVVGYNPRPAYPYGYGCSPYQNYGYGYGSGISLQGRNFGVRIGF